MLDLRAIGVGCLSSLLIVIIASVVLGFEGTNYVLFSAGIVSGGLAGWLVQRPGGVGWRERALHGLHAAGLAGMALFVGSAIFSAASGSSFAGDGGTLGPSIVTPLIIVVYAVEGWIGGFLVDSVDRIGRETPE